MKKSIKRTCAIALALAATAGVTGVDKLATASNNNGKSTNIVYADVVTQPNVLSISNYEKQKTLGDWFEMPTAFFETEGNTTNLTYVVTAPSGKTITPAAPTRQDIEGELGFIVDEIGTYKITYTVVKDTLKYTGEVTFESSVSTYSITLDTNNDRILPAKVGTKTATAGFKVPSYTVKDKNGDKVTNVMPTITVKTPTGDTVTVNAETGVVNFAEGYEFIKGTYIVDYYIYSANGQFLTKTSAEFKCTGDDSAYDEDAELVVSFTKEPQESVNIGKTVELPGVTAKIDGENVPVYYEINVFKDGVELTEAQEQEQVGVDGAKVLEEKDGSWFFTAKEKAGTYTVKYKIFAAGTEIDKEHEFEITSVVDSEKPTPMVVDYYDTETVTNPESIAHKLASTYSNKNITILPIYASDLGSFKFSDYKSLKREIKNSSYRVLYTDTENANKTIVFNYDDQVANEYISEGKYVVAKDGEENYVLSEGTYYVTYTATDAAGNSDSVTYKFVVDNDFNQDQSNPVEAPSVTFNDEFYANVDKGEEITFAKPTFADDLDERLETRVYIQYLNANDEAIVLTPAEGEEDKYSADKKEMNLEVNSNSKYVVDTKNAPEGATSVKIVAYAKNDAGKETTEVKTIKINSPISGTNAPVVQQVFTDGTDSSTPVKVGTEIEIPSVMFGDADDVKALDASISITYELDDKIYTVNAQNGFGLRNETAKTYTYKGASFTPGVAATYTIAIKAVDAEGNVTVQFIQYTVEDIVGEDSTRLTGIAMSDTTIELGESLKLPTATPVYPEKESKPNIYDYIVIKKSGPNGDGEKINKDRFIPTVVGEYVIQYILTDAATGNPAVDDEGEYKETYEFKVTVKDTTNPEIYVDWRTTVVDDPDLENVLVETDGKEVIEKVSPIQIESYYKAKTKVLLPTFSAKDSSGIDETKSTIVITNKATGNSRTIKYKDMKDAYSQDGDLYYQFNSHGEYTITYTAIDLEGNSSKQAFTIKIGDLDDPELTVSDKVLKSKYNVGDEITIDLTDDTEEWFTVVDADADLSKEDIKITLTVGGNTVDNLETEDGKYKFKLDSAGDYKLTFTVEDVAGNSTEVVKEFTIAEKSGDAMNASEVAGTVLIVVSVLVLAGVIVYFVISKRKMDKLYK